MRVHLGFLYFAVEILSTEKKGKSLSKESVEKSGDPRIKSYFICLTSLETQRSNAASILDTLEPLVEIDEMFYLYD